jgi:hypothetical protein
MAETRPNGSWFLEVVRGAEVGRRFLLPAGETVAGNALNGLPGLDLASQESGPRRMAGRQARFQCAGGSLTLFDLGSPGGTFVNRERLIPFQPRPLKPGDVIQMASVQLRVEQGQGRTEGGSRPPQPAPAPKVRPAAQPSAGFAFALRSGMVCRSWDDFLTASAQDWAGLREELVSGRLAAFLAATGRAALAPDPKAPGSPDERLDAWLAALPTTRTPQPELEVHPDRLAIPFMPGGGTTRRTLAVTNTGYRLLITKVRIEPGDTPWLRLGGGVVAGQAFPTVDRTDLTLEVVLPETLDAPRLATIVLESNGGERRVPVTLEPRPAAEPLPDVSGPEPAGLDLGGLVEPVRRATPRQRLIAGAAAGLLGRLAVGLASSLFARPEGPTPDLLGPALLGAVLGAWGGTALIRRRGAARTDLPAGAVSGGVAGVLAAAVVVAACRSVEAVLGASPSLGLTAPLWGLIGAALGGLSLVLLPPARSAEVQP